MFQVGLFLSLSVCVSFSCGKRKERKRKECQTFYAGEEKKDFD